MAFINCHKCNTRISDLQDECPHCGHPLPAKDPKSSKPSSIGYGLFFIVMSFVMGAAAYNYMDALGVINDFMRQMEPVVMIDKSVSNFALLSYYVIALAATYFLAGIFSILKSARTSHVVVFLVTAIFVALTLWLTDGNFFGIDDSRFVPHSAIRATITLHLALWPTLALSALNTLMALLSRDNTK